MPSTTVRALALTGLLASTALARTDLAGCTSTAQGNHLVYYVPGTGELCEFLDCGGGRAPPKTNVPGCPQYSGTSTYSPNYLPGYGATSVPAATTAAAAAADAKPTGVDAALSALSTMDVDAIVASAEAAGNGAASSALASYYAAASASASASSSASSSDNTDDCDGDDCDDDDSDDDDDDEDDEDDDSSSAAAATTISSGSFTANFVPAVSSKASVITSAAVLTPTTPTPTPQAAYTGAANIAGYGKEMMGLAAAGAMAVAMF